MDFEDALAEMATAAEPRDQGGAAMERRPNLAALRGDFERRQARNDARLSRARQAEQLDRAAVFAMERGAVDEAVEMLESALAIAPDEMALLDYGELLAASGQHMAALSCFAPIIAGDRRNIRALCACAVTLANLGRADEADAMLSRALAVAPGYIRALYDRILVARIAGRKDDALDRCEAVLARHPQHVPALSCRAMVMAEQGHHEAVIEQCRTILELKPDHLRIHVLKGVMLLQLNRHAEAATRFEAALILNDARQDAHLGLAIAKLAKGDFQNGSVALAPFRSRGFETLSDAPAWTGVEPLEGKTLLVHHEWGMGDTLQFVRYVPMLKSLGPRVILLAPPPLKALLETLEGVDVVFADGVVPSHDYFVGILSLPLVMGTTIDTIPAAIPYLRADPARVAHWAGVLGGYDRPRIGLVWAGRQYHPVNPERDMPLRHLLPLAEEDVALISLQKEIPIGDFDVIDRFPNLRRFETELTDFADTAALIENLDLVIAVDTSTLHLAGALGKPVWLLSRFAGCWRWLMDRDDSPWYPTLRIFRQRARGDWPGIVDETMAALKGWRP